MAETLSKVITTYEDGSYKVENFNVPEGDFGFLMHDYQTEYWHIIRDIPMGVHRGYPRKAVGQPETVNTFEKDDKQVLNDEWQEWYKRFWCLAAFGSTDLRKFPLIEQAFNNAMASNRVITNFSDWISGYMCLGMGGNIVKIVGEGRPNSKFGPSYVVETLNSSKSPPDVEDVFYNKPWLWSKATVSNYEEGKGVNPWQVVDPFPQLHNCNAHVPLMLINAKGTANIMKIRVLPMPSYEVPNPYNPKQYKNFP